MTAYDQLIAALKDLEELRAALAEYLDNPWADYSDGEYADRCRFCLVSEGWGEHEPECPVLQKDYLLGRAP